MHNQKHILQHALKQNNWSVADDIQEKMLHFLDMMRHWNRVYNLTAILEPETMIMLHLIDSLSISPFLSGDRIIDVGTGGGLPGIPLALVNPEKKFTLLDSNSKKTRFLTQVLVELKLKNIEIIHSRCEQFHPSARFDNILSRAFASLKLMIDTTQHLGNEHSEFLAMKGSYPQEELLEIPKNYNVKVHKLIINGLDAERHLVILKKDAAWEK